MYVPAAQALHDGLYLPLFTIDVYPAEQLVAYVQTPNGALREHVAPELAAQAVQSPHFAYSVTGPPLLVVRLLTLWLFVYATAPWAEAAHPRNFFVPFVKPFAVKALAIPYV